VNRRVSAYWWAASLLAALAAIGWAIHSIPLALSGTLGAITVLAGWVWQRECITNVTYTRALSHGRATFGEEITLAIEIVNDKLLPLTWLHIEDTVPTSLTIRGGTIDDAVSRRDAVLHLLLPMLPFGRVRRRLTVVCDRRGAYIFGPVRLESGDPIGYGRRTARLSELDRLLVYPKVFALEPPEVASRMLFGDQRSSSIILGDPSRVAGVREYRAGDPLRHVDWRASARSPSLLVRVYEPTTSLRVAAFIDLHVPRGRGDIPSADLTEFTVAVAASVITDLSVRGIGVGLYSTGTMDGHPLAYPPSMSPSALADMMELLARVSPYGAMSMAEVLASECGRFRSGISVVVIAADFPERTLAAMADLRRRLPVTSVWVGNDLGRPAPSGTVDTREEVAYVEDWKQCTTLGLAR
jgi:uncharacterized protein (DUF58 family)